MPEFKRARTEEQKEQRMQEVKDAVDTLFSNKPYHEITLTTIAEKLDWTRVNLYKYISTKEEIFLELCSDKRDIYYEALIAAFPSGCDYSLEVFAEVWSGILNAHQEHLHYCDILSSIIETNVSVERLAAFKKRYYEKAYEVCDLLAAHLSLDRDATYEMFLNIHYHAVGMYSLGGSNPLISEALKLANLSAPDFDFKKKMRDFIMMNLHYFCQK